MTARDPGGTWRLEGLHEIAIQCVGELYRGLQFLDEDLRAGAPSAAIGQTVATMRLLLDVLETASSTADMRIIEVSIDPEAWVR